MSIILPPKGCREANKDQEAGSVSASRSVSVALPPLHLWEVYPAVYVKVKEEGEGQDD